MSVGSTELIKELSVGSTELIEERGK